MEEDKLYMRQALELARQAAAEGEVPVGCVVVRNGEVVGRGRNHREGQKNALGHAELQAIDEACRNLGGWRRWE
jgi:tRNA(adenine34) deaminase